MLLSFGMGSRRRQQIRLTERKDYLLERRRAEAPRDEQSTSAVLTPARMCVFVSQTMMISGSRGGAEFKSNLTHLGRDSAHAETPRESAASVCACVCMLQE